MDECLLRTLCWKMTSSQREIGGSFGILTLIGCSMGLPESRRMELRANCLMREVWPENMCEIKWIFEILHWKITQYFLSTLGIEADNLLNY